MLGFAPLGAAPLGVPGGNNFHIRILLGELIVQSDITNLPLFEMFSNIVLEPFDVDATLAADVALVSNFTLEPFTTTGAGVVATAMTGNAQFGNLTTAGAWQVFGRMFGFISLEGGPLRTNLNPYSGNDPGWTAAGTSPPTISNDTTQDGRRCTSVTFSTGGGYAASRAVGTGFPIEGNQDYVASVEVKLSRPLIAGEILVIYCTGSQGGWLQTLFTNTNSPTSFTRYSATTKTLSFPNASAFFAVYAQSVASPVTVYLTDRQFGRGTVATAIIQTSGAPRTEGDDIGLTTQATFGTLTQLVSAITLEPFDVDATLAAEAALVSNFTLEPFATYGVFETAVALVSNFTLEPFMTQGQLTVATAVDVNFTLEPLTTEFQMVLGIALVSNVTLQPFVVAGEFGVAIAFSGNFTLDPFTTEAQLATAGDMVGLLQFDNVDLDAIFTAPRRRIGASRFITLDGGWYPVELYQI